MAWPLFCLAVALTIGYLCISRIDAERESVRAQAFREAQSLSRSYAEQLSHTVAHLDQITKSLAYYWEKSGGTLNLEEQAARGLYPTTIDFSLGVVNRDGDVVTGLLKRPQRVNLSDRPYFQAHKSGAVTGLHVHKIDHGRIVGKPVIIFSRALKDKQGKFDGIVYVGVAPEFLASFYDNASEGDNGGLALVTTSGEFLATKLGRNVRQHGNLVKDEVVFPKAQGVQVVAGSRFLDERSRIVAWNSLEDYPFVSVVAMAEEDLYASFDALRRDYMGIAVSAIAVMFLLAVVGCVFIGRLAWRKHQAAAISETYRLATEGAREGFFMIRSLQSSERQVTDFVIERCNEQGANMLGYQKYQLHEARFSQLYTGRAFERVMTTFRSALQKGFLEDEFPMLQGSDRRWMYRRIVRSDEGLAITLRDITDAKDHEQALHQMATVDSLTRLPNRNWLSQRLPEALEAAAASGKKVALLFIDLDDFKNVNNTRGHAAGDEVLRQASLRMQSILRYGDEVVRLGGDEFVVVLPGLEDAGDAVPVADRILDAFASPFSLSEGSEHVVYASAGLSVYPDDGPDMDSLLKHADTAMFAAKRAGKGRLSFYTPQLTEEIVNRTNNEQGLRHAIKSNQFIVHYQPRVNALTGELVSMEALVRWLHPTRGLVPPMEFIPLAEETGLIVEIGEIVLHQVCAQIVAWQQDGLPVVPISVNVSPRQFTDSDLEVEIATALTRFQVAPSMLELEITESCMLQDSAKVAEEIASLKALGIRVSVDDFGTGYSSLSQLQRLDLDVLKIDRSFTIELENGKHGVDFFRTIVSMAHVLDMQVVAEGVENPAQLRILQALGCDEIQGYFVSRPVPAEAASAFLQRKMLIDLQVLDAAIRTGTANP
ncbi:bifunctional diguanylate cyclase/phosphodiesterase [Noviherbaspirillum humi]|nr:EAL domain-containing protein [Noviherbaspirillum humi]